MSVSNNIAIIDYGLTQALQQVFPTPIVAKRAPTTNDKAPIGQLWVQPVNTSGSAVNSAWILTSIISNSANWESVSGGAGSFTTVTSSGNITSTAGNISATIGSVSAGSTIAAGTGLSTAAGNITASDGNVVISTAGTFLQLPGPVNINSGAGAPAGALALHIGDMYINTTAASATTRIYVATAVGTWTNVTCAA